MHSHGPLIVNQKRQAGLAMTHPFPVRTIRSHSVGSRRPGYPYAKG